MLDRLSRSWFISLLKGLHYITDSVHFYVQLPSIMFLTLDGIDGIYYNFLNE